MKVIALGILSGATGDRYKGEEFTVDAKLGEELVGRGLVSAAPVTAPVADKPAKTKE
ncbi:hypothetical protein HZF02_01815 [Pseudomonas yamanorum]|nr:hypothetical protein HZF02_01815 [Pseudomonas yamanorum]